MLIDRKIDWVNYLNSLNFCYGCGRFGLPMKRGMPRGWKVLYQPHADAPPGLHVCGSACAEKVRQAMTKGPVLEPLKMGVPPLMPGEMKRMMFRQIVEQTMEDALLSYTDQEITENREEVLQVMVDALMGIPKVREVAVRMVDDKPVLDITEQQNLDFITLKFTQDTKEEDDEV